MPTEPEHSKIPQLKSSCCGCSLETGSKVIGIGSVIVYVFICIIGVFEVVVLLDGWTNEELFFIFKGAMSVIFYYLFSSFCKLLLSIYLIIGIYKNKQHYIKTWVVVQGAFILIAVCSLFIYLVILLTNYMHIIPYIILESIGLVIQLYCTLIVYSYYRGPKAGNEFNLIYS